jgi:hypothetical protein
MNERLRDLAIEIATIYVASTRLQMAFWVTVLSPLAVLLLGLLIPVQLHPTGFAVMTSSVYDALSGAVPWAAAGLFGYMAVLTIGVYVQERRRLLLL